MTSNQRHACYSDLTHPDLKQAINLNCLSTIRLANLVADFAQEMSKLHEQFSKQIQTVIQTFRTMHFELKNDRPPTSPCSLHTAWECLLRETEIDSQGHMDTANLLVRNVFQPLKEVASHKSSQAEKLQSFRNNLEDLLQASEKQFELKERDYLTRYNEYRNCGDLSSREVLREEFHLAHNDYVFQIRASNRTIDEFQISIPKVLEEMDEIYIDTSNTINVAIESHTLLLLTKADEQQLRYKTLLKTCSQVNPQCDIACFVKTFKPEEMKIQYQRHQFTPADLALNNTDLAQMNRLVKDKSTDTALQEKRTELQRQAVELTSLMKQNQEVTQTLVNICQRNLANHLYAKVYETQEDMCRKRNELRVANLQLGAVRSQLELLTTKQNGVLDDGEADNEKKTASSIRGMWKKAVKSLKSSSSEPKLFKKGSLYKKKQNSKEEEEQAPVSSGAVDPVYSLLKCAQDLPKSAGGTGSGSGSSVGGGKSPCMAHPQCSGHPSSDQRYMRYPSGGDSSGNTSKTSSPSSSASHSPKTRRKKLNARMKSFSLDTPEPPKQLLGIDETTKRKSSSFTNTCFGATGKDLPDDRAIFSASSLRKKFASTKASSLELEERLPRSYTPSPKESPKASKKQVNLYVALYNFKAKEKDDMDLRAGWRVNVTDSSKKDWWKGKCHGKSGYFPATYVIPVQKDQRVFQVTKPLNLADGSTGTKFHKDQVVLQVGDEADDAIMIRAANNRQARCPLVYLQEL